MIAAGRPSGGFPGSAPAACRRRVPGAVAVAGGTEGGRQRLHANLSGRRQIDPALAAVDAVVGALDQPGHQLERLGAGAVVDRGTGRLADDQRRAGLIDQHTVGLVDDREIQAAHHQRVLISPPPIEPREAAMQRGGHRPPAHLVAQVVEHQLLVAAINNVAGIGRAPLGRRQAVHNQASGQPERLIHRREQGVIAPGEIVVHRHHVHHAPRQRRGRRDERGGQRLALAGRQLRHPPAQHRPRRHELHVVRPQAQKLRGNGADQCKAAGRRGGCDAGPQRATQRGRRRSRGNGPLRGLARKGSRQARHVRGAEPPERLWRPRQQRRSRPEVLLHGAARAHLALRIRRRRRQPRHSGGGHAHGRCSPSP